MIYVHCIHQNKHTNKLNNLLTLFFTSHTNSRHSDLMHGTMGGGLCTLLAKWMSAAHNERVAEHLSAYLAVQLVGWRVHKVGFPCLFEINFVWLNQALCTLFIIQLHIPPMDAIIFPGHLRPGKRIASIGRRLLNVYFF